jgi:hypothetical protein
MHGIVSRSLLASFPGSRLIKCESFVVSTEYLGFQLMPPWLQTYSYTCWIFIALYRLRICLKWMMVAFHPLQTAD